MHLRFDHNLLLLWLFLSLQVVVLVSYFVFSPPWASHGGETPETLPLPVKFVSHGERNLLSKLGLDKYKTYFNTDIDEEIYLRTDNVEDYFTLVNDTLCFKHGTDIGYMERNSGGTQESGKCDCLPGYHSNDCSLPEVIWRAFIASRHAVITKRSTPARRVVLALHIAHPAQIQQAAVFISCLGDTADLFVLSESNSTEYGSAKPYYLKQKLDKGLLKELQYKILYSPLSGRATSKQSWERATRVLKNLRDDDIFFTFDASEIPSPKALLFFKLFDGFSLPIDFRLKWNVYGYFYQHPNKTRTVRTGTTVHHHNTAHGLMVGDLNHYGGWLCDLCYDPNDLLNVIQSLPEFEKTLSRKGNVVDVKYLEQLIGDGHYIDGKTELLRTNQDRDAYYAPPYVTDNYWRFDSLLINFYNKVDYS